MALSTVNLSIVYTRWGQTIRAVDQISLSVSSGDWIVIAGHNGSGKSTLLRAVAGRIPDFDGDIFIGGRSIREMSPQEIAKHVFLVHQNPLLGTAPKLTLYENLFVADDRADGGDTRKSRSKRYARLLEPIGLSARIDQAASTLSGGERQYLSLLIARLRPSPIILLDEPLTALDPILTARCLDEIATLHAAGRTLIHVTHDLGEISGMATRRIILCNGRIMEDETLRSSRAFANAEEPVRTVTPT